MAWVRMDDRFPRGLKVKRAAAQLSGGKRRARGRVLAVWIDALTYCAEREDGWIFPEHALSSLPDNQPRQVIKAMVDAGILECVDGGWWLGEAAVAEQQRRDQIRSTRRRRRVARRADATLTEEEWRALQREHGFKCVYCGEQPDRLTQDHVVPLCRGGRHERSNVVPACGRCNSRKGTKSAEAFRALLARRAH